jgi:hypothetical protein
MRGLERGMEGHEVIREEHVKEVTRGKKQFSHFPYTPFHNFCVAPIGPIKRSTFHIATCQQTSLLCTTT